jgi:hypothetical protein
MLRSAGPLDRCKPFSVDRSPSAGGDFAMAAVVDAAAPVLPGFEPVAGFRF